MHETKFIKDLLLLDMRKLGFNKSPVVIQTSYTEFERFSKEALKDHENDLPYLKLIVLKQINKSYDEIDSIKSDINKYEEFFCDCLIYCALVVAVDKEELPVADNDIYKDFLENAELIEAKIPSS